jgi:hypothetical protein
MSFQTTVSRVQGFGIPGELYDDGPRRVVPYTINSPSAANNVFGRGCSITAQGIVQAGNPGGTSVYAGILVNPKNSALFNGNFTPTLTLANDQPVEVLDMGSIVVSLPAIAAIGDWVVYDQTTGELSTVAPGDSLPVGKSWANAVVDRFTVASVGGVFLGVIKVTSTPTANF